ncbi:NAD+ synthase (glutamine-hydrolysing) [Enhydrobacter aerosaccus]|uniref:Glutamine-dependent NAD(+) synthetase n=1 Tax=Enhydrobacter aerosaccus TaxID=225324 RepID=A0A1T4S3J0_9HYPH|nr:NAD(+) synthase [Enhydrobacter aerosaccus]SKA22528.1 NAD+ synthase (glutamine-hydrolysing) [Enhydrobacter aerosaccus]
MKSDFFSLYSHDFVRVACCVPRTRVADAPYNLAETLKLAAAGDKARTAVMVFPELGLSSYAIEDLLLQDALLDEVEDSVAKVVEASKTLFPVLIVGAPLRLAGRLYNTAIVIHRGKILGVVPKTYLPNYREFYEKRHFVSGANVIRQEVEIAGHTVPFGTEFLFEAKGIDLTFHVEICEDIWVPVPPSSHAALAGAELLVNLSASNITIGKAEARQLLCGSQSMRAIAAYAYSAAGPGESTTDLAWDGQAAIYEVGDLLAESSRFEKDSTIVQADVDVGRIRQERLRNNGFADCALQERERVACFKRIAFSFDAPTESVALDRLVERFPYVPSDPAKLRDNCYEAYNIQVQGLAQRFKSSGVQNAVIGVSGGLDSTHALIVTCRAMDMLGLDRKNVKAFTLPGFGTSDKTYANAWRLMKALGVTADEIDIKPAAKQMLADIGHSFAKGEKLYDVTFENVQAGLRTDYLFRLANQHRGLVVGTGDLSELGLGWCTYGVGDHMSHYNPNGSVSKTLIQHLIRFVAASGDVDQETAVILHDILNTEISPELIPADAGGVIQSTEQFVGPYALQDFNLYYLTRLGYRPSKIAFLAWNAWHDVERGAWPANLPEGTKRAFALEEIRRWLELFLRRFFSNQFKRSALPNGPKISSGGSLSPRGDWRAPSDGSPDVWLAELKESVPER